MATATLNQILQRVGELVDQRRFVVSTATDGSTTTLVDAIKLLNSGRGEWYADQARILRTDKSDGDRFRSVVTDVPGTGTLTVSPAWTDTVASTDPYQLWPRFDPEYAEDVILRTLEDLHVIEKVEITGVDDQRQYALSGQSWFIRPEQYLGTFVRLGDTANEYTWRQVRDTEIRRDQDAFTLQLNGEVFTTDDTLEFRGVRDYKGIGAPTQDGVTTTTALVQWVGTKAALRLVKDESFAAGNEGIGWLERMEDFLSQEAAKMDRSFMPKVGRPLFKAESRRWGPRGRNW